MKLNKKGDALLAMLPVGGVPIAMTVIAVALIAYSFQPKVLEKFRDKKAEKICIAQGGDVSTCKTLVGNMDKVQVLAYIKDDLNGPGNGGNFAGGNSN